MVKPVLFIRADGDSTTGMGHLMRCLSLASAWQEQGGETIFLSHSDHNFFLSQCNRLGIMVIKVETPYPHKNDLSVTLQAIKQQSSQESLLVLDGYFFDLSYQDQIRSAHIPLLVIDDNHHLSEYHADYLLNQNLGAEKIAYHINQDTKLLLGTQYTLLAPNFNEWQSWQRHIPSKAKNILVTLGGSDPTHLTSHILNLLKDFPIKIRTIVGPMNPDLKTIKESFASLDNIEILTCVTDMPALMSWADLILTASGTTVWESAYMGLPAIFFVTAANQETIAKNAALQGIGIQAGSIKEPLPSHLKETLHKIINTPETRRHLSNNGRRLIDGSGAKRVVETLLDTYKTAQTSLS
jgi:UDP-2,4-diacetamido-2,4,6-trideoxy-beta-L-altropyranose hydrolase